MDPNFLNKNNVDKNFKNAVDFLFSELKAKYSEHQLKKLEFDKVNQLVDDLENFKPRSQIRQSKMDLIKYLLYFTEKSNKNFDSLEVSKLQAKYILPTINNHMYERGYAAKWVWLWGLLFLLPVDIILWFFFGEYYFYLPIVSLPYTIKQIRDEIEAKKKNRLW